MEFRCKLFPELTNGELYDLLRLRAEVFVVEQDCAYVDPDGLDPGAVHLLGLVDGKLIAYCRWMAEHDSLRMGRIVTTARQRRLGYGRELLEEALRRIGDRRVVMHAQTYLEEFYETFGFAREGDEFAEDGIPHVRMVRCTL